MKCRVTVFCPEPLFIQTLLKSRGHLLLKGPNDLRPVRCQGGLATSVISINIHLLGSMKGSGQSLVKEAKLFSKDCDQRPTGIQRLSIMTDSLLHSPKNWPVLGLLKCSVQNISVFGYCREATANGETIGRDQWVSKVILPVFGLLLSDMVGHFALRDLGSLVLRLLNWRTESGLGRNYFSRGRKPLKEEEARALNQVSLLCSTKNRRLLCPRKDFTGVISCIAKNNSRIFQLLNLGLIYITRVLSLWWLSMNMILNI